MTVHQRSLCLVIPAGVLIILAACGTGPKPPTGKWGGRGGGYESQLGPVPATPATFGQLQKEANVRRDFIGAGRYGRRKGIRIKPEYITIHSTQNWTGDAYAHAKALKRGALRGGVHGYMCWHFTVQDDVAIQHMPTSERGEHADFDGPGNSRSIGIEMCEHRGNNIAQTIDRTAKLTATLMHYHKIPLNRVVPHYHWPRKGKTPANKNCPHFLLDGGRPGPTWAWFLSRVDRHFKRLQQG